MSLSFYQHVKKAPNKHCPVYLCRHLCRYRSKPAKCVYSVRMIYKTFFDKLFFQYMFFITWLCLNVRLIMTSHAYTYLPTNIHKWWNPIICFCYVGHFFVNISMSGKCY